MDLDSVIVHVVVRNGRVKIMKIDKDSNGQIVCRMSEDEFIGIFRTIGQTNYFDRMRPETTFLESPGLTEFETKAVSSAYTDASDFDERLLEERKS